MQRLHLVLVLGLVCLAVAGAASAAGDSCDDAIAMNPGSIANGDMGGHTGNLAATVSAVETVNPKIPSTLDAAVLSKMAERGQIRERTAASLDQRREKASPDVFGALAWGFSSANSMFGRNEASMRELSKISLRFAARIHSSSAPCP